MFLIIVLILNNIGDQILMKLQVIMWDHTDVQMERVNDLTFFSLWVLTQFYQWKAG